MTGSKLYLITSLLFGQLMSDLTDLAFDQDYLIYFKQMKINNLILEAELFVYQMKPFKATVNSEVYF